jgi:hypothetical protein
VDSGTGKFGASVVGLGLREQPKSEIVKKIEIMIKM